MEICEQQKNSKLKVTHGSTPCQPHISQATNNIGPSSTDTSDVVRCRVTHAYETQYFYFLYTV